MVPQIIDKIKCRTDVVISFIRLARHESTQGPPVVVVHDANTLYNELRPVIDTIRECFSFHVFLHESHTSSFDTDLYRDKTF